MNKVMRNALSGAILVLSAQVASAACTVNGKCNDAAAVEAVRLQIAADCDCGGTGGRKAYMKCVKDGIKAAIKGGTLPKPCKKAVKGCESKSTCGQAAAVVCCQKNEQGKVKAKIAKSAESCSGGSVCNGARYTVGACTSEGSCLSRPFKAVQQIFSQSCALPTCHSALAREGDLVLDSEDVSYESLVDRPAKHPEAGGLMRVRSGDPENSFLIQKLRGLAPGDRMPVGAQLPEDIIEIIEAWITRGAHGTSEECPAALTDTGEAQTAAHGTHAQTICDDAPIDAGNYVWQPEPPLEVPEKGQGFQLYAPPRPVEPGTEWETCLAFKPDWQQIATDSGKPNAILPALITRQVYRMHSGSHHLLLWAYNGEYPDQWPTGYFPCSATNCINPGECPPDAGDTIPIGGTQVAGIRYEVNYPSGVGLPIIDRDTVLIVNLHYTNPFLPAQEIVGEAWLNLYVAAPGTIRAYLDGIFGIGSRDLVVEPYETKTMSSIWRPVSVLNSVIGGEPIIDAAVFQLFGHMHKRGGLFQADYVRGGTCSSSGILCGRDDDCRCKPWYKTIGAEDWQRNCMEGQTCIRTADAEDTTIYRTTQWDNAPVVDFQKPYLFVNKNEGLRWTCTHTNGVAGDPTRPPKKCHEGCRSCGWDDTTRTCTFRRGVQLGVHDTPRVYQEGEPIPLVFGELADDDMCNLFGYMIKQADLAKIE